MSWRSGWIVLVEEHFASQEKGCVYRNLENLRVKGRGADVLCTQRLKVIALDKDIFNGIRHGIENLVL